jgi:hypothetical protein
MFLAVGLPMNNVILLWIAEIGLMKTWNSPGLGFSCGGSVLHHFPNLGGGAQ